MNGLLLSAPAMIKRRLLIAAPYIIYVISSFLVAFHVDWDLSLVTKDADAYLLFGNAYFKDWQDAVASYSWISGQYQIDFARSSQYQTGISPVYILFLLPSILGLPPFAQFLIGLLIGLAILYLLTRLLFLRFPSLAQSQVYLAVFFFSLNPHFLIDSIGASTISIQTLFLIIAFLQRSLWCGSLIFATASFIRPDLPILGFSFGCAALIVLRRQALNKLPRFFLPACIIIASSIAAHHFFYSNYLGGNQLRYLYYAGPNALEHLQPSINEYLSSALELSFDKRPPASIQIVDLLPLFTQVKTYSLMLGLLVHKLLMNCGFFHAVAITSPPSDAPLRIYELFYFLFQMLGVSAIVFLLAFDPSLPRPLRLCFVSLLIFLVVSSVIVAAPRYLVRLSPLLSLSIVILGSRLSSLKSIDNRHELS